VWVRVAVTFVLLLLPTALHAQAEKRIALLIGNKDYKPGVGALTNPLNDIRIVGDALKYVGFEVMKPTQNATRVGMLRAILEFASRLKAAGPDAVGFLYYSGHGMASAGENYLIPVDVDEPTTVELSVQGVKQSEVLAILRNEAPKAAHYLVLDACRNTLQGARGGKGFVPVGQQSGVLVAFATEPGKTASDLGQGSGPYAAALAVELRTPGQNDLLMFHHVRVRVMDATRGDQVPWMEDGIMRRERTQFGVQALYLSRPPDPHDQVPRPDAKSSDPVIGDFSSRARKPTPLTAAEERTVKPGGSFKECDECPEMVVVPADSFRMGSPVNEMDRDKDEGPQRKVTIARQFAVGKFEVTAEEWDGCAAESQCRPSGQIAGRGKHPIVHVSWNEITNFYLPWLSRKTGKTYRLLTEAEWEYVARAGTRTPFSTGLTITSEQVNFSNFSRGGSTKGKSGSETVEVGSFQPNAFGLYDMHGNVWEWTEDCYKNTYLGAPIDGSAVTSGDCNFRVLRGGSWSSAEGLRSADRGRNSPDLRDNDVGFRVARTLD
jgi:formylglycine-generating enzyme required for sulfatase activity